MADLMHGPRGKGIVVPCSEPAVSWHLRSQHISTSMEQAAAEGNVAFGFELRIISGLLLDTGVAPWPFKNLSLSFPA